MWQSSKDINYKVFALKVKVYYLCIMKTFLHKTFLGLEKSNSQNEEDRTAAGKISHRWLSS